MSESSKAVSQLHVNRRQTQAGHTSAINANHLQSLVAMPTDDVGLLAVQARPRRAAPTGDCHEPWETE